MSDEKVETTEEISARWNKPPQNEALARMVGETPDEGDTRATVAYGNTDDPENFASSKRDASLPAGIDVLEPSSGPHVGGGAGSDFEPLLEDYDDATVPHLKAEIDRRNDGRDDDEKISKSGNKDDLVAALTEDDDEDDDV